MKVRRGKYGLMEISPLINPMLFCSLEKQGSMRNMLFRSSLILYWAFLGETK